MKPTGTVPQKIIPLTSVAQRHVTEHLAKHSLDKDGRRERGEEKRRAWLDSQKIKTRR